MTNPEIMNENPSFQYSQLNQNNIEPENTTKKIDNIKNKFFYPDQDENNLSLIFTQSFSEPGEGMKMYIKGVSDKLECENQTNKIEKKQLEKNETTEIKSSESLMKKNKIGKQSNYSGKKRYLNEEVNKNSTKNQNQFNIKIIYLIIYIINKLHLLIKFI